MIALIPFRKGSKRVKDKNIRTFNGKPLFMYTFDIADDAQDADIFSRTILATDYPKGLIENYILGFCEVFERDPVGDAEPASKYILEVIKKYELQDKEDICLLQPTCPLRSALDVIMAVKQYEEFKDISKTLVSVTEVNPIVKLYEPYYDRIVSLVNNDNLTCETHTKKNIYTRNSSIYIFNVGFFKETGVIFEKEPNYYVMPWYRSVDIDSYEDFDFAEKLAKG